MAPSSLSANEPNVYEAAQRRHLLYREIEGHEAFRDYVSRLTQLRDGVVGSLLRGDADTGGNKRDDEKRMVIDVLDKIIDIPHLAHRQWDGLDKQKRISERNRPRPGPIHGADMMRP